MFSKKLLHASFKGDDFSLIESEMAEKKLVSTKDRKARKKYMEEPSSAGLQTMVTTIIMFPIVAM